QMSTTTTNRLTRLALALALSLAAPAASKGATAKGKAADKTGASLPEDAPAEERPIPPALQKAIEEKEGQVTTARREAIRLIEDYLRDSPRSKEQAEALY